MNRDRVINVDLDGVVYPWHEVFATYASLTKESDQWHRLDNGSSYRFVEPTIWDFWEQWNMSKEQWVALFRKGVNDGYIWQEGKPIKGAQDTLWRLSDDGYLIRYITHRLVYAGNHRQSVVSTATWLDNWNLPYWDLCFLSKYTNKSQLASHFAIDDKWESVVSQGGAGSIAALFARRWNQSFWAPEYTVHSWRGFYDFVNDTVPTETVDER